MKKSFEKLNPTSEQGEKMWKQISQAKTAKKSTWVVKAVASVAAAMLVFVGVNTASGGQVMAAIRQFVGLDDDSREIVEQATNIQNNGVEVYAPEIYYLDDEQMIFGGLRGLLVYNRVDGELEATIDLQEIDSIYFNSETKATHVLKKDDAVYVFNSENGEPKGKYYRFELSAQDAVKMVAEAGEDVEVLKGLYEEWQVHQANYVDTFRGIGGAYFLSDENFDKCGGMYSKNTYCWTDAAGNDNKSCLLVKNEGEYSIYTYNGKQVSEIGLNLEVVQALGETEPTGTVTEPAELPAFTYSGEDMVVAAVCDYLVNEESKHYYLPETEHVVVPTVKILGVEKSGDKTLVFGKFAIFGYTRNGEILECVSGGNMVGCLHLQEEKGAYKVTEVQWALDGGLYDDSIKEMTADYPQYYEGLSTGYAEGEQAALRMELLSMYVKDNQLPIKYYKDYGWDPVQIE